MAHAWQGFVTTAAGRQSTLTSMHGAGLAVRLLILLLMGLCELWCCLSAAECLAASTSSAKVHCAVLHVLRCGLLRT